MVLQLGEKDERGAASKSTTANMLLLVKQILTTPKTLIQVEVAVGLLDYSL